MKSLHIFTSSKGGIGKTLLSTASAIYLSSQGNTLCIDLNWQNPDLSSVLSRGADFRVTPDKFKYTSLDINSHQTILRQKNLFMLPKGAVGFWENIISGIDQATESSDSPNYVVVDTCMHLSNLVKVEPEDEDRLKKAFQDLGERKFRRIYIWFIWTLTALKREDDKSHLESALGRLRKYANKYFPQQEYMIHVFNPYAVYSDPSFLDVIKKSDITFKKMANLLLADSNNEWIDYNKFSDTMDAIVKDSPAQSDHKEYLENIGEQLLDKFNGIRPSNLVPMPTYDTKLSGFTDVMQKPAEKIPLKFLLDKLGHIRELSTIRRDFFKAFGNKKLTVMDTVSIALKEL